MLTRWHRTLSMYRGVRAEHHNVGPVPEWPPSTSGVWENVGEHVRARDRDHRTPLNGSSLEQVASLLRTAAHSLGPGDISSRCLAMASRVAVWGDDLQSQARVGGDELSIDRISSARLLEAIRIACMLKGGPSKLASLVRRCVTMAAPPSLVDTLLDRRPVTKHSVLPLLVDQVARRVDLAWEDSLLVMFDTLAC
jgi:hypothetical protein